MCHSPENSIQGKLEINHKDGNRENWDPLNLELTHGPCNREHFLAGLKLKEKKIERENTIEPTRPSSWESSRSLELRPTLELECRRLLLESGKQADGSFWVPTVSNMENRLSKILECDQEVVTKMINRELQPEGFLAISERTVEGRKRRTAQILSIKKAPSAEMQAKLDELEKIDAENRSGGHGTFLNKNGHKCKECGRMNGKHSLTCSLFREKKVFQPTGGAPTF